MTGALAVVAIRDGRAVAAEVFDGDERSEVPVPADAALALTRLADRVGHGDVGWYDLDLPGGRPDVRTWPALLGTPDEIRHAGHLHRADAVLAGLGAADFVSPLVLPGRPDRPTSSWPISPVAGVARADTVRRLGQGLDGLPFAVAALLLGRRAALSGSLVWSDPAVVEGRDVAVSPFRPRDVATAIRHGFGRRFLWLWLAAEARRHPGAPALAARAASQPGRRFVPEPPPPTDLALERGPAPVDVVLPTLGRRPLVDQVLRDLADQLAPPRRVVVVEQVPEGMADPGPFLELAGAPFELVHRRISTVGAVNARNLGITACESEWVLFVDDDVRLPPDVLAVLLASTRAHRAGAAVACVRLADGTLDHEPPADRGAFMWVSFNTGASLVRRDLIDEVGGLDRRLEGGYGEDHEFGIRLRRAGAMIVYEPRATVGHLQAQAGGLRHPYPHPWRGQEPGPVPSPTLLLSQRLYQTDAMRRGYTAHYWARRLARRWPAGPGTMWRQWTAAQRWADWLEHSMDAATATALERRGD